MSEGKEKRTKKLTKEIAGNLVNITEGITGKSMIFDFGTLPAEIQAKLGPFGLGHKLGDGAAGKEGAEAVEAIEKVWNGLMANDWSVRAPAGPKVNMKEIEDKIAGLSEDEQAAARALLAKLGVKTG